MQDLYNPCKLKVTVQLDKQYNLMSLKIELMIPNRRTSLIFHYYVQNANEKTTAFLRYHYCFKLFIFFCFIECPYFGPL